MAASCEQCYVLFFRAVFTQAVHDCMEDAEMALTSDDINASSNVWWNLPTSMLILLLSVTGSINYRYALLPQRSVGMGWVWFFIFFIVFCRGWW